MKDKSGNNPGQQRPGQDQNPMKPPRADQDKDISQKPEEEEEEAGDRLEDEEESSEQKRPDIGNQDRSQSQP